MFFREFEPGSLFYVALSCDCFHILYFVSVSVDVFEWSSCFLHFILNCLFVRHANVSFLSIERRRQLCFYDGHLCLCNGLLFAINPGRYGAF